MLRIGTESADHPQGTQNEVKFFGAKFCDTRVERGIIQPAERSALTHAGRSRGFAGCLSGREFRGELFVGGASAIVCHGLPPGRIVQHTTKLETSHESYISRAEQRLSTNVRCVSEYLQQSHELARIEHRKPWWKVW
jgi:hypothetical protein